MITRSRIEIKQTLKLLALGVLFLFSVQSLFQITIFLLFGEYKGGLISARFLILDGIQTWPVVVSLLRYVLVYLILLLALSLISLYGTRFLIRHLSIRETISKLVFLNSLIIYVSLMVINVYHFPNSLVKIALVSDLERNGNLIPYFISLTVLFFYLFFAVLEIFFGLIKRFKKGIGKFGTRAVALSFLLSITVVALAQFKQHIYFFSPQQSTVEHSTPHIILLGLDSVRLDILENDSLALEYMPNLNNFLSQDSTSWYLNSFTPIARTFAAWYALLSGKSPVNSGVRYNLQQLSPDKKSDTILQGVREKGYYTIYGSDEKRFSTIDQSYGFDETLGPPPGAAEWILSFLEDTPIHNAFRDMKFSEILFPYTYGNRASYTTYEPNQFVGQINRKLDDYDNAKPLFLALHFCLSHWPYLWSTSGSQVPQSKFLKYLESLKSLDEQFGQVLRTLEANGLLQNSLLVVFTDHGEGFSEDSDPNGDSILDSIRSKLSKSTKHSPGHGTDLLNIAQNQILVSLQDNTSRKFLNPGKFERLTSLVDIAPTIAQMIGIKKDDFDGISLAKHEGENINNRIVFMETGFDLAVLHRAELDIEELVKEGSSTYEINEDGMLQVKTEFHDKILREKQKGATDGRYLIANGGLSANRTALDKNTVVVDLTDPERISQASDYLDNTRVNRLKIAFEKHFSENFK